MEYNQSVNKINYNLLVNKKLCQNHNIQLHSQDSRVCWDEWH